jgi:tetratricopeptide (TPR) repeat protein
VTTLRTQAWQNLNLANEAADNGDYENALAMISEARRFAVSSDDPELRIRTRLALGNIQYGLGNREEARASFAAAAKEASSDKALAALCGVYQGRADLQDYASGGSGAASPQAVREAIAALIPDLQQSAAANAIMDQAMAWRVLGTADKALRQYPEAVNDFQAALGLHSQGNYLKEQAGDYYLIASVYSQAAQYSEALDALYRALDLDRRCENTIGLAFDWEALSQVYAKAANASASQDAAARAKEIREVLAQ